MTTEKWFSPTKHSGWQKDQPAKKRRALVLKAHKKDYLSAARSMQALANVTQDKITKKLARSDAVYFYDLNKKTNRR